jgi:hypothetical protein
VVLRDRVEHCRDFGDIVRPEDAIPILLLVAHLLVRFEDQLILSATQTCPHCLHSAAHYQLTLFENGDAIADILDLVVLFKDREWSQFLDSLPLLLMVSMSYLLDVSPITLMTQLAAGDYYAGPGDVAVYGALLVALVGLFLAANKRLMAIKI